MANAGIKYNIFNVFFVVVAKYLHNQFEIIRITVKNNLYGEKECDFNFQKSTVALYMPI